MTLLMTGSMDMGRYPESKVLSVPLGTGNVVVNACCHAFSVMIMVDWCSRFHCGYAYM